MLELVARVAAAEGESVEPDDLEAWWAATRGGDLDYSRLLEYLAPTPLARRDLLRSFFEPTSVGAPEAVSLTHDAIARLVASGSIHHIITTNFDRLFENALQRWQVRTRVVSNLEADGLAIFDRTPTVVKIHGDYLDLVTRNTRAELAGYGDRASTALRELFSGSGIVIAGWSASWDEALRELLIASPSPLPTYWVTVGPPTPEAMDVIRARSAAVIECDSADQFFTLLESAVDAIRERGFSRGTLTTLRDLGPLRRAVLEDQTVFCRIADDCRSIEWHERYTLIAVADGQRTIPLNFFWPRPDEVQIDVLAGGTIIGGLTTGATGAHSYTLDIGRELRRGDRHYVQFVRTIRMSAERMPPFIGWSPQAPTRKFSLTVQFDPSSLPHSIDQVVAPAGDWPNLAAVRRPLHLTGGLIELEYEAPLKGYGYGIAW